MSDQSDQSDLPRDPRTYLPIPDPTTLTNELVERAIRSERERTDGLLSVLEERLRGMDRATELLNSQMTRVPSEVDKQVAHLRELHEAIFAERDRALQAALSAAKESTQKEATANQKAIDKSEVATADAIDKLGQLGETRDRATAEKIDDLKDRVSRVERDVNGAAAKQVGGAAAYANIAMLIVLIITIAGFGLALLAKTG